MQFENDAFALMFFKQQVANTMQASYHDLQMLDNAKEVQKETVYHLEYLVNLAPWTTQILLCPTWSQYGYQMK